MTFPTEGNWRYRVELSDDGGNDWKLVADQTQTGSTEKARRDPLPPRSHGRFLRVTFTGLPAGQSAALAEVSASGTSE